jgi:hypothetical protein
VRAQYVSNLRSKNISLARDTVKLDSISIVPNTMILTTRSGKAIDTSAYVLYPLSSMLIWKKKPLGDSVIVATFRVANVSAAVEKPFVSNLRNKHISMTRDTVKLDSLSIVPNTMQLRNASGQLIDTSAYDLYPFSSLLVWRRKPHDTTAVASFRVYPFAFANRYFNKDHDVYIKAFRNRALTPYTYVPNEVSADKLIDFGSLDYNGNFSRGVGFGSTQSVTLNSSFNMQLQGMLTKDLEITAAITDNNIPIQPEGNTQQLQDFDKIFIQLRYKKHTVIVGDFDMNSPADYFLHYTKKAEGGGYTGIFDFKKAGTLKTHIAGGISKGVYATNNITPTEGNQGPYSLTGTNGETYIIVLANSESVYINGTRLTRGASQDYVINYNSGTITFTPKRIITADMRIRIEFEYSQLAYQRSMIDARIDYTYKKLSTFFDFYSEQDAKNEGQNQTLTDNQKLFLASLGDSTQKAFYTGVDTVPFDVNRVLYARHDTFYTVNGASVRDTAYIYSTDSTKAIYGITFALVGQGLGDYNPAQSTANGSVYVYSPKAISGVAPNQQLIHTGSYLPIVTLIAPQLHQMYTVGASYDIDKHNKVSAEVAMSNTNMNEFSTINKKNDVGAAAKVGYNSEIILKSDSGRATQKLNLDFSYEFSQNNFRAIERYRTVEFDRDFNVNTNSTNTYNEHLASFIATYSVLGLGNISYRFRTFIQDSVYKGFENYIAAVLHKKSFGMNFNTSYLHTESLNGNSDFLRPTGDFFLVFKALKGIRTGISFDHEINIYRDKNTDTLTSVSHIWQNYHYYIGSTDTTKTQYRLEYTLRTQAAPAQQNFKAVDEIANTVTLSGSVVPAKNQTLRWNFTYRNLMESDTAIANQEQKNYYLGRLNYSFTVLKGLLRSSTLYELGAGREQKQQLIYLVSPNNTGNYVWIGKDPSQPKQIQDFVPLTYITDTSYVRSYITTPQFYSVNTNTLNEVLNVTPASLLHNASGIGGMVSKLSLTSNLQLTKKIYANKDVAVGDYFNPFPTNFKGNDTNIVALNMNSRNSLYINKTDPKLGGQFDFNYTRGRTLLTAGLENRLIRTLGPTVRWNIYKQLNLQASYTNGLKASESDYDLTESYRIVSNETNTELSYLFKSQMRLAASYYYGFKSNKEYEYGGQFAVIHTVALDFKYNRHNKTTVGAKVSYSNIGYGDAAYTNNQAQYAMLEGLENGNNLVWNVSFEQRLSSAIQLIISYDGRKTGGDKVVNTAHAEIRAVF